MMPGNAPIGTLLLGPRSSVLGARSRCAVFAARRSRRRLRACDSGRDRAGLARVRRGRDATQILEHPVRLGAEPDRVLEDLRRIAAAADAREAGAVTA